MVYHKRWNIVMDIELLVLHRNKNSVAIEFWSSIEIRKLFFKLFYFTKKIQSKWLRARLLNQNHYLQSHSSLAVKYSTIRLSRHEFNWTYGRVKPKPIAAFKPDFVQKDKIILTFDGFFRQRVFEPISEQYDLIRKVKIMYFMEDDTITVVEPAYIVRDGCSS